MANDRVDPTLARGFEPAPDDHLPLSGCLLRICWMLLGPLGLAFGAALTAMPQGGSAAMGYLLLFGSALASIGLRYVDLTYLDGRRASGEPAKPADFTRYLVAVAIVTLLLWGAAKIWQG
ncbi:MAG: hypothetical protein JW751_27765 [Polyangiaceae bacterium]|nr:hypothetical protein [Polyangiaceae bacterium]